MNIKSTLNNMLILIVLVSTLTGCNAMSRNFGGTQTINLPPDQKLDNVTWKDNDLWILSRPMTENEDAQDWTFQESSNMGLLEGKVLLKESKSK